MRLFFNIAPLQYNPIIKKNKRRANTNYDLYYITSPEFAREVGTKIKHFFLIIVQTVKIKSDILLHQIHYHMNVTSKQMLYKHREQFIVLNCRNWSNTSNLV